MILFKNKPLVLRNWLLVTMILMHTAVYKFYIVGLSMTEITCIICLLPLAMFITFIVISLISIFCMKPPSNEVSFLSFGLIRLTGLVRDTGHKSIVQHVGKYCDTYQIYMEDWFVPISLGPVCANNCCRFNKFTLINGARFHT